MMTFLLGVLVGGLLTIAVPALVAWLLAEEAQWYRDNIKMSPLDWRRRIKERYK